MTAVRYAGLDLGGTNIKTVVVERDADGEIRVLSRRSHLTHGHEGADAVVDRVAALARAVTGEYGAAAVGLGIPGWFDPASGCARLIPNIPGEWSGKQLRRPVETAAGRPVVLINDARAFALAESRLGAARGLNTVVCVTLGTGMGGGVVIGGRLHMGTGDAGEIGHQTLQVDGPLCGCGNRGCAEALVSSAAVLRMSGRSSVEEVYEAARAGDERAVRTVDHVIRWLAVALVNAYTLLAPDALVIGGGVAAAGDALFGPLEREVRGRITLGRPEDVRVLPAVLGTYAGALGAALAVLERDENGPVGKQGENGRIS
ncbi:ROK family protein [Nonomuraea sp. M3C6]|uniref:ROK family protein n=1 Tax=Nonomuraea marmarensis TaxID=3351344 RepID=A0ABW7AQ15_9ACTN